MTGAVETWRRRAEIHAALSEPVRLAIVDHLRVSDRAPVELSTTLDVAPSLLAFHLDVLERAGVVERVVSAGDRRRRYVRLLSGPLDEITTPIALPDTAVTFVCTHNSARSQLAAALWRAERGGDADSAGTDPADAVHPGAVAAAARAGLDLGDVVPRRFEPGRDERFVVTVCDRAHEDLRSTADWHWSVTDPAPDGSPAAFDAALDTIRRRIRALTDQESR